MAPLRAALACALGVLLLAPQAAAGGGWWSYIDVNRSTVAPGQRVEVSEAVLFSSAAEAERAQEPGQFYAYLLRDFDYSVVGQAMRKSSPRNWWSLGGAEAIQVGPVDVNLSGAQFGRATAEFIVPELPPATYHLMLCDAGCSEPLADVIPAKDFTVVADPATAQTARRVDRLERRTGQLAAVRADAERARVAAHNARSEVDELEASVSAMGDARPSSPPTPRWAYGGWLVAGALAGALAMLLVRRRRSRPPRPAQVDGWQPTDEELRQLLSSETQPGITVRGGRPTR